MSSSLNKQLKIENDTLLKVVSKILGVKVVEVTYQNEKLHGGTIGNVFLITGKAKTISGEMLSYKTVLKQIKNSNDMLTLIHGEESMIYMYQSLRKNFQSILDGPNAILQN